MHWTCLVCTCHKHILHPHANILRKESSSSNKHHIHVVSTQLNKLFPRLFWNPKKSQPARRKQTHKKNCTSSYWSGAFAHFCGVQLFFCSDCLVNNGISGHGISLRFLLYLGALTLYGSYSPRKSWLVHSVGGHWQRHRLLDRTINRPKPGVPIHFHSLSSYISPEFRCLQKVRIRKRQKGKRLSSYGAPAGIWTPAR